MEKEMKNRGGKKATVLVKVAGSKQIAIFMAEWRNPGTNLIQPLPPPSPLPNTNNHLRSLDAHLMPKQSAKLS